MATITNVIRWADNSDQLARNLSQGIDQIEVMTGATRRMVEGFDGSRLEREAHRMTAAVTEVGGASRLTEAEQAKVNRTLQDYITKAELMGRQVPTAMRDLAEKTRQVASETEKVPPKMGMIESALGRLGPMIVAAFSVGAITNAIRSYTDFTGKIGDLSDKTGISTTALQRLKFAAEQNGTTLDAVSTAVMKLGQNLAGGNDSAEGALKALGLSLDDIRAMQPDEAFVALGDAIAGVEDPMDRAKIATDLFGRAGAEMLPMFRGNLQETMEAADRLGIVLTDKTIRAGQQFGDQMTSLTAVGRGVIAQVLQPMIPGLTTLAQWLGELIPAAIRGARAGFDFLIQKGMEVQVWIHEFILKVNELGARVPWLGAKLGASSENLDGMRQSAQFARDALDSFKQQTAAAGAANETTGRTLTRLNLDYGENKRVTDDAARAAAQFKQGQDALFGRDLIARAIDLSAKLGDVGNVAILAAEKKRELRATVVAAIDAYDRLGMTAPQKLRDIEAATRPLIETTHKWGVVELRAAVDNLTPFEASVRNLNGIFAPLRGSITDSAAAIAAARERMRAAAEAAKDWRDDLDALARSMAQMAQVAGGSFGGVMQSMASLIIGLDATTKATDSMKKGWAQATGEGGNLAGGLLQMAAGAMAAGAAFIETTGHGSTMMRTLGGMAQGAQIGSMFGPWGTAIGAAAGALVGFARGIFGVSDEIKKVRAEVVGVEDKIRDSLTATQRASAGGERWRETIIGVRDMMIALGGTEEQALALVRQLWDTDHPNRARAAMEEINRVMEQYNALLAENNQAQEILNAAVQRYGFTIAELGPTFQRQRLTEMAQQLDQDFRVLVASGIEVGTVAGRMADATNEYLHIALQTGQEVPASMRPMLEKMLEMGLLTDESGAKMTDLSRLSWAETLTQGIDRIVAAIERLASGVGGNVPAQFDRATRAGRHFADETADNMRRVQDEVDALNFGHSPGGLKEIPILLRAAGLSSADFKNDFINNFTVCGGILDDTFQPKLKDVGKKIGKDLPADIQLLVTASEGAFPKVGDLMDDVVQKAIDPWSKKIGKDLPKDIALLATICDEQFPKIGELMDDTWGKSIDDATGKLKSLKDLIVDMGGDMGGGGVGGDTGGGSVDIPILPPPKDIGLLPSFAGGSGGIRDFGAGMLAVLHGRERVQTEREVIRETARVDDVAKEIRALRAELARDRRQLPGHLAYAIKEAKALGGRR